MVSTRTRVLFDTNILIDYLNGIKPAKKEIEKYSQRCISQITWMEVMVGATEVTENLLHGFLLGFERLTINDDIAAQAVKLRQNYRIKLPDAIVWATAQLNGCVLITRNTKNFPAHQAGVHIPYRLTA
jgi:predicted nucleic acid-binding protein